MMLREYIINEAEILRKTKKTNWNTNFKEKYVNSIPKYLYHLTNDKHIERILKRGLIPSNPKVYHMGKRVDVKGLFKGVYLTQYSNPIFVFKSIPPEWFFVKINTQGLNPNNFFADLDYVQKSRIYREYKKNTKKLKKVIFSKPTVLESLASWYGVGYNGVIPVKNIVEVIHYTE